MCMEDHDTVVRFMSHLMQITNSEATSFKKLVSKIDALTLRAKEPSASIQRIKQFCGIYTKLIKNYRTNISSDKKMRRLSEDFITLTEQTSIQKIEDCFISFLALPINKISPAKIDYTFSYNKKSENLQITEFVQYNKANGVIFHFKKDGNNLNISSDVINQPALNRSKTEIIKLLTLDSLELAKPSTQLTFGFGSFASFKGSTSPFAAMIAQFLSVTSKHLLSNLADLQINHVSPLRAFPQRYYLLDKSVHHRKLNALDGTELAEVLKNNPTIKDNINILLAPFNIGIDIEKVNDIIYKIVVNQENVNLELTDVGFGISQVLPILVQAYLSPSESLTIIEQPEIHLHPNMQAWLTDAIINIALTENKRFLIETHSDALIRRLRLRIVDDSSKLSEEDVKIYHLHRDRTNKCTILDEIEVNDNGDIKWPKDFMDVEIKDTIQIQQLKYEKINKDHGAQPQ